MSPSGTVTGRAGAPIVVGRDKGTAMDAAPPPSRYAVLATAARNGRLRRALAAYLVFNIVEWAT